MEQIRLNKLENTRYDASTWKSKKDEKEKFRPVNILSNVKNYRRMYFYISYLKMPVTSFCITKEMGKICW